mgnify:CR=1 FL=1
MGNTPNIRFKGFTDDWEQRKLGEISNKITKKNQDIVADEVFTNSAEYGIISQRDFFDKDIANSENIASYYIVEPNDFVYNPRISTTAPFGPVKRNKLERTGAMSPLYYVFRPHDIDLSYLECFFQTSCWHAFMRFNGNTGARSDRFAITDKVFGEMPISMPQDIEEQKKIGAYFEQLDNLITLHQRKCDETKELKKFMLQKMFPKKGEKKPEIRFAGFTDDWEQRKVLDLLIQPVTDGPHETPELVEEGVPFISVDAIVDNKIDFSRKRGNISEKYDELCCKKYKPQLHDVYLVKSGSTVGKVAIVETTEKFNIWSPLAAMRCGDKTYPYFLYNLLQTKDLQAQVADKASNGTQPNLSMRELEKFPVCVPSNIEEQKKIGAYFEQLDNLITLHQRKCDEAKELKKFMLQNMFV